MWTTEATETLKMHLIHAFSGKLVTAFNLDLQLPALSWGLCRCSWFQSWCLWFGCNASNTDSHSPAFSTWRSGSCLHTLPLYSNHTALSGDRQKRGESDSQTQQQQGRQTHNQLQKSTKKAFSNLRIFFKLLFPQQKWIFNIFNLVYFHSMIT